jgi:hypothetical protein
MILRRLAGDPAIRRLLVRVVVCAGVIGVIDGFVPIPFASR